MIKNDVSYEDESLNEVPVRLHTESENLEPMQKLHDPIAVYVWRHRCFS